MVKIPRLMAYIWPLTVLALLVNSVTQAQHNADDRLDSSALFIESALEPLSPYVQQQMLYRVRLYCAADIRLSRGTLSTPQHADAIIEPLGADKRYKIRLGNRDYRVLERTYAVLAQSSGPFHLTAAQYVGFAKARPSGGALINSYRRPVARSVRVQGRGHGVLVRARPDVANKGEWIPATALIVFDSWHQHPPLLVAGEPVSRTISISARGLTAAQLPAIIPPVPNGVRIYPAPATIETVTEGEVLLARRTQTFSIVANHPTTLVFPKLVVPWWHTQTNEQRTAQTPTHTLTAASQSAVNMATETRWPWYAAAAATLLLISTVVLIITMGARRLSRTAAWQRRTNCHHAARRWRAAVRTGDVNAARRAALAWAAAQWRHDPPSTLAQVAARVDDDDTKQCLFTLHEAAYARPTAVLCQQWRKLLLQRIKPSAKTSKPQRANAASLPSLY